MVQNKEKIVVVYPARHISISILRSVSEVYEFISDPMNLPKWAAGLSRSEISQAGDEWIADSPMGQVKVKFTKRNPLGVVDHDVTLPDGEINHNPLRVLRNGDGSEVVFTLYRLPRMSEDDFEQDAQLIEKDLIKLKLILEG